MTRIQLEIVVLLFEAENMSLFCKTPKSIRSLFVTIAVLLFLASTISGIASEAAKVENKSTAKQGYSSAGKLASASSPSPTKAGQATSARRSAGRATNPRTGAARTGRARTDTLRSRTAKAPNPIRLKIEVPCRAWLPKNVQPKVILLCVHGLGLNSDAYEQFGQQMQKEGIGVFAVDVRGFGTWMQLKGKTELDFESCISDVEKALKVLRIAYPDKPIFVLGESMGGAIAMRVAADHPDLINGLVSAVPTGDRFHKTKNQLRVALQMVTLRGNKQIDVGTKVIEQATDDPALQESWKDDPLNRLKLSSKELRQFQRFMNENHETAERIDNIPVLFLVGLSDRLAKPEGTIELFDEISADDKKLVSIKSAEHLIFEHHQLSPDVKRVVVDWLLSHAKKSQKDD